MPKLTNVAVRNLKPRASDYFVRDSGAPGFGVRVRPSGHIAFEFIYTFAGRRRRLSYGEYEPSTGLTLEAARKMHAKAAAVLASGSDPAVVRREKKLEAERSEMAERNNPTVKTLAKLYIEQHAKIKKRSWREDERILNRDVIRLWGPRKVKNISRSDVNALLDEIAGGKRNAGVMANRTLALVRKLFNFASGRDFLGNQASPAARVEARAVEMSRERVLTDGEVIDLFSIVDGGKLGFATLRALRLIVVTGQRPGEVAGMRWADVEGDWWTLQSSATKNKSSHRVYLGQLARLILEDMRLLSGLGPMVFPLAKNVLEGHKVRGATVAGFSQAVRLWQKLPEKTKNEAGFWTPHDLRRTCATNLGRLGVSRFIQDRVLNHKDASIGGIYDRHEYDHDKKVAMTGWNDRLMVLLSGVEAVANS